MPTDGSSSGLKRNVDRKIKQVVLGNISFDTWFDSRYPEELVSKSVQTLYVCRWCFRYSSDKDAYISHTQLCRNKTTPPGTQIYDDGSYSVWEIDGEDQKLLAQNLSLFAKLFLDHKSVFLDVASFLFYLLVLTNPDDPSDYYVLGYFSKEKMSWDANNLACILIFPPYQHRQLGKLLMGISYRLSAWEWENGVIGGPEKPLSEMGYRSYVRFWGERIARFFLLGPPGSNVDHSGNAKLPKGKASKKKPFREEMTIEEIGKATGMLVEDIITALKSMGIVEAEKRPKKRKKESLPANDDVRELAVIRKGNVLEWVKAHNVSLQDPVNEEGFLGEWAPKKDTGTSGAEEK